MIFDKLTSFLFLLGNQYAGQMPSMAMPSQYPQNSIDPTKFVPNAMSMQHASPQQQYQYSMQSEQPQSLQQSIIQQTQAPPNAPGMHSLSMTQASNMMPPQMQSGQQMPQVAPNQPSQFPQHVGHLPQANYSMNNPNATGPMLNNQPNMPIHAGHLPNTVMTTQVQQQQQHHQQPPIQQQPQIMQNPSPNHQIPNAMAAVNQPVSTTILPQNDMRSNIPIYQQQR